MKPDLPSSDQDLLAYRLRQAALAMPGAPERETITELLEGADWFVLSEALVKQFCYLIDEAPHKIEHNLDFLGFPGRPLWVEYFNDAKPHLGGIDGGGQPSAFGERRPVRIGFLLSGNAEQEQAPETIFCLVAWQFADGATHFSPATLYWDIQQLTDLATMARFKLSRVRDESIARLLEAVHVSISPGFSQELDVLHDSQWEKEKAAHDGMRDSVSEAIFILSALLFLNTPDAALERVRLGGKADRDTVVVSPVPSKPRNKFRKLLTPGQWGFYRQRTRKGELLRWRGRN